MVSQFFLAWALHCSVHQKPKALAREFVGIEIVFVDPDQANLRLKSKSLLQSPRYALQRYFLLCQNISGRIIVVGACIVDLAIRHRKDINRGGHRRGDSGCEQNCND